MKALRKAHKKPIIAVVTGGSAVDLSSIEPYADAIIFAWYPGEQGGSALADILFWQSISCRSFAGYILSKFLSTTRL